MSTTIIVSYDNTDNDRDALALGKLLAEAGASLAPAYVRHSQESDERLEELAQNEAEELLLEGARLLGDLDVPRHVVLSASTGEGLLALAKELDAAAIVFGSEYRTAPGHVQPGTSALRLLEGGTVAVGIAPSRLRQHAALRTTTIGVVGEDGDPSARDTADSLAGRLGASVTTRSSEDVDLLVIGSQPSAPSGTVRLSAVAQYLIETV